MTLATLVRARLDELDLSYRQAAERSGGLVSYTHLHAIATGTRSVRVTAETLRGVAKALALPLEAVAEAAGAPEQWRPFVLPDEAGWLNDGQRRAVLAVVRQFLADLGRMT